MNDNVDPAPADGTNADHTASTEAEVKPKPTRRKRAVVSDAVDAATGEPAPVAPEPAVEATDAADAEPVPKPRRARAVPRADHGDVESTSGAAGASSRDPTPAPVTATASPRRAESSGDGEASREQNDIGGGHDAVDDAVVGAADGDLVGSADGDGDGASGEAGDGPRSRRRNRRDRKRRGARAEGADGDSEGATGAFVGPLQPKPPAPQAAEVFEQVLSGVFDSAVDAPEGEAEATETKRVLAPEPEAPKLHKVLAQSGIGSRRDMEELIADGFVTVNGEPAHTGQRVSFGDQVHVKGKPVRLRIVPPPPRIIAYHKPVGEIVTHDDPQARPTVFRRLPRLQQGKWQSVGRLDINTEGLLLFTTSGGLANQLMHPRFGVEREYAVRVLGTLSEGDRAELLEGVDVDGQKAQFRSITDGGGEGANHWYRCVITEGRNREVRKLFDAVDLTVSRLIRIRYGTVVLPHGLKRGAWVDLDENDIRAIRRLAAGDQVEGNARNAQGSPRNDDRQGGQASPQTRQNGPRNKNGDRPRPGGSGGQGQGQGSWQGAQGGHGGAGPGGRGRSDDSRLPLAAGEEREPRFERDEDFDEDDNHGPIPNPLEQTFDKRFVTNPRSPAGGRGFGRGGGGFGAGGSAPAPDPNRNNGGPRQPDPMQTSVGYIGADAFHRKNKNRGPRGGGGGGGFGGGNHSGGGNNSGGGNGGGGYKGGGGGGNAGGRRGR